VNSSQIPKFRILGCDTGPAGAGTNGERCRPFKDRLTQLEVVTAEALQGAMGIRASEMEPWPEDETSGDATAPWVLEGPILGLGGERPWLDPARGHLPR
jgi:hypothetical protein